MAQSDYKMKPYAEGRTVNMSCQIWYWQTPQVRIRYGNLLTGPGLLAKSAGCEVGGEEGTPLPKVQHRAHTLKDSTR